MSDYQEQALRTKSDRFYEEYAPAWMFVEVLADIVEHVRKLDALKKALFYGKPLPPGVPTELYRRLAGDYDAKHRADPDVLHGIVGIVTEAGELAELLLAELAVGEPLDYGKAAEETGDLMWYQAVLLAGLGRTFPEVQEANIGKLKRRYPERFTSEAALARADEQV